MDNAKKTYTYRGGQKVELGKSPDNMQSGIERTLNVSDTGQLDDIGIDLDITHSYISDLIVELVTPENTSVFLHNRSGRTANNIIKTFTLPNTSILQGLRGETISGDWKLRVSDHARIDQGKLDRWALHLTPVA